MELNEIGQMYCDNTSMFEYFTDAEEYFSLYDGSALIFILAIIFAKEEGKTVSMFIPDTSHLPCFHENNYYLLLRDLVVRKLISDFVISSNEIHISY